MRVIPDLNHPAMRFPHADAGPPCDLRDRLFQAPTPTSSETRKSRNTETRLECRISSG